MVEKKQLTEQEAINALQTLRSSERYVIWNEALDMAILALENKMRQKEIGSATHLQSIFYKILQSINFYDGDIYCGYGDYYVFKFKDVQNTSKIFSLFSKSEEIVVASVLKDIRNYLGSEYKIDGQSVYLMSKYDFECLCQIYTPTQSQIQIKDYIKLVKEFDPELENNNDYNLENY